MNDSLKDLKDNLSISLETVEKDSMINTLFEEVFPLPYQDYIIRKGEGMLDVLFGDQKNSFSYKNQAEELMELVDKHNTNVVKVSIVDNESPFGGALVYFNDGSSESAIRYYTLKCKVSVIIDGQPKDIDCSFNVGQELTSRRLGKIEWAQKQPTGPGDIPRIFQKDGEPETIILVWVKE